MIETLPRAIVCVCVHNYAHTCSLTHTHLWCLGGNGDSVTRAIHALHKELEGNQSNQEDGGSILNIRIRGEKAVILQLSSLKHQSLLVGWDSVFTAMVGPLQV